MQQNAILDRAYPIIAGMIAGRADVELRFCNQARTDGDTIYIPYLKPESGLSSAMLGYTAHEAGHVRYTDMSLVGSTSGIQTNLLNCLEDPRVEAEMVRLYPGVLSHIKEMNIHCEFSEIEIDDPNKAYLDYCLLRASLELIPEAYGMVEKPFSELKAMVVKSFGKGVFIKTNSILSTLKNASDTFDVLEVTNKLIKMLEEVSDPDDEAPEDSDDSDDQGLKPEGSAAGDQTQPESGEPSSDDSSDSGSNNQGNQKCAIQSLLNSDVSGIDKTEVFLENAQDDIDEANESYGLRSSSSGLSDMTRTELSYSGECYANTEAEVVSSRLRQQLQRLLEAQSRSRNVTKRSGRRIKSGRITRLLTGDTKIFASKVQNRNPDTAVHLVGDFSSSMSNICGLTKQAIYSLMLGIHPLPGVSLGVGVFQGNSYRSVLEHNEHPSQNRLSSVRAAGGTPMAESLYQAALDLVQINHDRKIMMVLTDGAPYDRALTTYMIDMLVKHGVEVIGIGIKHDVSDLYPDSIRIDRVEDLSSTLLRVLGTMLINQAA